MKIFVCEKCGRKNYLSGMKNPYCIWADCVHPFDENPDKIIEIQKEPFTKCPMCGKEHEELVTKCKNSQCGFCYDAIDSWESFYEQNMAERKYLEELESRPNIPTCPTCGSTDLHRISTTEKAVNTGIFGLFGTKRHKTFRCNNCKYEW